MYLVFVKCVFRQGMAENVIMSIESTLSVNCATMINETVSHTFKPHLYSSFDVQLNHKDPLGYLLFFNTN